MNDLLMKLYDIEGLDPISWWPLAPGWWVLLGCIFFLLGCLFLYLYQRRKRRQQWQYAILNQLSLIGKTVTPQNSQAILIELSQLIRRIAMHLYSRNECAGLEGDAWLAWLEQHDPAHFKWTVKGKPLREAPYAPSSTASSEEIHLLLKAIRRWVK